MRAARAAYRGSAPVTAMSLLTADSVCAHHEFREQPLPAWAVRFGDDEGATAYVPAELGQVVRIRNDFNNLVLRAFSVFGLVTVGSGVLLFALTSPTLRRRARGTVEHTHHARNAPVASARG